MYDELVSGVISIPDAVLFTLVKQFTQTFGNETVSQSNGLKIKVIHYNAFFKLA